MKRVLLIGATGKLGKKVLKELAKDGSYEIGAYVRSPERLTVASLGSHLVRTMKGDILDVDTLSRAIQWSDIVVNCSGFVSYHQKDHPVLQRINADAVSSMLTLCVRYNKKLIHTSSTSVYGCNVDPILFKEEDILTKKNKKAYYTPYALSKLKAEKQIHEADSITRIVLRPSSLISPERSTIKNFYSIYKKGFIAHLRGGASFALMDDVANTYLAAIKLIDGQSNNELRTFNLGGHNLACNQVFETFQKLAPQPTFPLTSLSLLMLSQLNDRLLYPLFGCNLISRQNYRNGSRYNYIDSDLARQTLSYQLTPFETALSEIVS